MKTVVGIDLSGNYMPALETCLELDFPNQEYLFVHAIEPLPPYAPEMPGGILDSAAWIKHLRSAGDSAVTKAEARACRSHIQSDSRVVHGSPAGTLIAEADDAHADLIAVGSAKRSPLGGFLLGSVARALAIGAHQSILATKGSDFPKRPLKALFATDHSEYANKALEQLIRWAPKGLGQIDVVSAYEVDEGYVVAIPENIIDTGIAIATVIHEKVEELTDAVSSILSKAGYRGESHTIRGYPNTVIADQMKKLDADILIIGAQGHGFLERMLVGSTALHQMVTEPYPVLIIRP